jgi:Flp pilus assembly secretin CpaC
MRFLPLAGLAGSIILLVFGTSTNAAEPAAPTADARGAVAAAPQNSARALRGGGASQVGANGAPIILEVNKGTLIRLTAPAATVFIANPDIAECRSSHLR